MELSKSIHEFPGYEIAYNGRVYNSNTGRTLSVVPNSRGIAIVGLMKNGVQHKRSLARLVADHFLDIYPLPAFDTPIHLDGNRFNCDVTNLAWRPLWFARAYHDQFARPVSEYGNAPIACRDTGENFPTVREPAMQYGLLEAEIILGAHNNVPVFPTWQSFHFLSL